jgi:peptidoglycan/LPS O-acetylase OafA/YrhL
VFVLSLVCIIANNFFFFPYIAFSKLFVVWYSGFFLANLYLEKKLEFDRNFWLSLVLTALSGALLFLKRSDSLFGLFMGLLIGNLFYVGCIIRKRLPARIMDGAEKAFNFLFYQLGKGSYALYLLHFPLILVLQTYANMNIWIVILSIILLAFVCIRLEEFFVKRKFLLLRFRYIR